MKVLQFAFDPTGTSDYLPCNYKSSNYICYTSTHDSDTLVGWVEGLEGEALDFCLDYFGLEDKSNLAESMIRAAWSSIADVCIAQPQDILGLGNEARINIPSTVGTNWRWRISSEQLSDEAAAKLMKLSKTYNRYIPTPEEETKE